LASDFSPRASPSSPPGGRSGLDAGRGWLVLFGLLALLAEAICLFRPGVGLAAITVGVSPCGRSPSLTP